MFAAQQFAQVPGAALRYIAGTHREASLACAARFGLADVQRADVLFAMPASDRSKLHEARFDFDNLYSETPKALAARG